jgi:hypothetical protein
MKYFDLRKIDKNNPDFLEWKRKAEELTEELNKCATHCERMDFLKNNRHWGSSIKRILKDTFGNLCWYSDSSGEGQYLDVDHFRPKGSSKNGEGVQLLEGGYWWLAYDYENYRLSCEVVNRGGKKDCFPIEDVTVIGNIDLEKATLLDPCVESDTRLIGYREGGQIVPETSDPLDCRRVKESIRVYRLNDFVDGRNDVIQRSRFVFGIYKRLLSIDVEDELFVSCREELKAIIGRKSAYSSVAYNYLMNLSIELEIESAINTFKECLNKYYYDK